MGIRHREKIESGDSLSEYDRYVILKRYDKEFSAMAGNVELPAYERYHMLTRRSMLVGTASALAAPLPALADEHLVDRQGALRAALNRPGSLAASAARLGILFGTAEEPAWLNTSKRIADIVARECSVITPGNSLKVMVTRTNPDRFDFSRADEIVSFAQRNSMAMRGHTLIFDPPRWAPTQITTREAAAKELLLEVTEPMQNYRGKFDSWDVVNEPINPYDNNPGSYRNNFWYKLIGPDYIPMAFTAARAADPHATLVLNEQGLEWTGPAADRQRAALLALLRDLKRNNVPVDALGLESHFSGSPSGYDFDAGVFDRFLGEVLELGVKILVTEMDFIDKKLPGDIATRDNAYIAVINQYLPLLLKRRCLITLGVWGVSDRYSWLQGFFKRSDGLHSRGCLYDFDFNQKPIYGAFKAVLDKAEI
jgi:endo-1,4-beta-xylanase